MVLDQKKVACTLQVGGEVLPQVEEFKYLGVLFTSEGRMDREIDRQIGAAAAVKRSMYRSVVVKKELSRKVKLSIYQSIYVPTLTYGHELWVMTEREKSKEPSKEADTPCPLVPGDQIYLRVKWNEPRREGPYKVVAATPTAVQVEEAAGMRVSTSKAEAMVLNRKKVACTLQVGGELRPQMEEFKFLGSCLRVRKGWIV
ncbi:hypothetical protein QTP86_011803 [Hemibagrus guttatus]|nr:hypothetical protein QTP86_011803 [Hemibagrus guttatus]